MNYLFGKLAPIEDPRRLLLASYLPTTLPPPPQACSTVDRIADKLKISRTDTEAFFTMHLNDQLGCCTIAALAHFATMSSGLIGLTYVPPDAAVRMLYMRLTGGQDTGLAELTVMRYARQHDFLGEQPIAAFADIMPARHRMVKTAIDLFGGVYLGFNVQENAIADFEGHRTWQPGELTGNGHAVLALEYDLHTITVATWGRMQKGTWEWWDACVDEAHVMLPWEATRAGYCEHLDYAALQRDIEFVSV